MISKSILKASIDMAASSTNDFAKKKRANRSAKLKQYKLDARREQWLSQVKSKDGCKVEGNVCLENKRNMPIKKVQVKPRNGEEICGDGSYMHHCSDSESSPSNSPFSHSSSLLGSNDSGINFTASSSSSSSTCSNCFTGSMSEDDEGDAGDDSCLDDWEAMADALAATNDKQQEQSPHSPPSNSSLGSRLSIRNQRFSGNGISSDSGGTVKKSPVHLRAWRPDDAFRPWSLPNLPMKYSSRRYLGQGVSFPASCPICCEDLDCTDSSFLPCLCGFRLCLFCHKRILEEDGRCPGCRKHYERDLYLVS